MKIEWTDQKIKLLREIFFKKWQSIEEDERRWSECLMQLHVTVMGPRDLVRAWNMGFHQRVCIENPTFEDAGDVIKMVEEGDDGGYGSLIREETWYLIPDYMASRILILGYIPETSAT